MHVMLLLACMATLAGRPSGTPATPSLRDGTRDAKRDPYQRILDLTSALSLCDHELALRKASPPLALRSGHPSASLPFGVMLGLMVGVTAGATAGVGAGLQDWRGVAAGGLILTGSAVAVLVWWLRSRPDKIIE